MKRKTLTIGHNDDDTQRFEMSESPLPLLPALLIFVFPDSFGALALDRSFIILGLLRGGQTCLICLSSTLGKVSNFGSQTRLEVEVRSFCRGFPQREWKPA